MSSYLIEHDRPAHGFYAVDSSLTQLSEAEHKMQSETIKHYFVEYLIAHERQAVYVFGHTAYIVNGKWLFSGDCIIANENGGYCFYDFRNTDSELNKKSAEKLKEICEEQQIEKVITSHSGILSVPSAFSHKIESPAWREKSFVFCKDADEDPYSM